MRRLRSRLTYANVVATLALFMAMSGGVVWAAHRIGANQLKANSVGTSKIKRNAVTPKKIRRNAVTTAKIADGAVARDKIEEGAVDFSKIATGANVIASAGGGPVAVDVPSSPLVAAPLSGTTSFTPIPGVVDLLSVEARGVNLARSGTNPCTATVIPYVNGKAFQVSSGFLNVASDSNTPSETLPIPVDSETGPIGLGESGVPQQISVKVAGNPNCAAGSQVAVSVAVTQLK